MPSDHFTAIYNAG